MTETLNDFNIDLEFFVQISELSDVSLIELYDKLHECYLILDSNEDYTMSIFGVLKKEEVFFEMEFMKIEGESPIFINFNEVDMDTYLDAIIKNQTIEQLIKNEKNERDISLRKGEN